MDQISDATIAEIEKQMSGDGVWIDPAFAKEHGITAADEAAIEDAVASATTADLRVVLVDIDYEDARFQGNFANLSAWIQDDLGNGGVTYVGWGDPGIEVQAYGSQPDPLYVNLVVAHDHPDDVAAQVLQAQQLLEDGNAQQLFDEIPEDERYSTGVEDSPGSGLLGDIGVGIGIVVALAAVVTAVVLWRRRRTRTEGFALPSTVLHTVREAEDRRLREQAESEVLALGEAIGEGEATGTANGLAAWQQALDHYAAARSILSDDAAPADVVGALVLARRGEDARETAQERKPSAWRPPLLCWFNPLHTGPTTEVTWRDGDARRSRDDVRAVEVPACEACASAVRTGREPDDVLDFIQGDTTVHYYRLDLGPWSATGYGTLDRDLLGALRTSSVARSRRRVLRS